ncbi:hypothetical protein BU23DRAFT_381730, partial [Bimuria novae-zelandiae CBS 107.79]
LFKPLLSAYSKALTTYLHEAQGLLSVKKGDFFPLFWEAWTISFKKKMILKSFKATGIWPRNAEVILQKYRPSTPVEQDSRESSTSVLSGKDWLKIETLVRNTVREEGSREVQKLKRSLHHISVQNDILHAEVQGLTKALQEKEKVELEKARKKAEITSAKLRNLQEKKERERLRVKKREEKERVAAEKQAEQQQRIQEKENSEKAIQTSQKGKRKVSKPAAAPKQKKKQRVVVAEGRGDRGDEIGRDPAPTTTTRRGRNIKLLAKFQ